MMVEPKEAVYLPKHMKTKAIENVDLKRLKQLVEQLPEGTVISVDLREVLADGQKDG